MAPEEYYIFTGRDGEEIPRHVTHVLIDISLKFVRARAFDEHPNIEELECYDGVKKIEEEAFRKCPSLRRVIIPGVKEVEERAFHICGALTYIECGKLERIGKLAFAVCESLNSIDLPSIKIIEPWGVFGGCTAKYVKFGKNLERIGYETFRHCPTLERITLPLKDGMIADDSIFMGCDNLNHVDLVGDVHETVAALLLERWRNDVNEEIDALHQVLPMTHPGHIYYGYGAKARLIRSWIRSVLRKITHYKTEHRRYLNMAAALEPALSNDIVLNNVLPFLAYTSEGEDLKARISRGDISRYWHCHDFNV